MVTRGDRVPGRFGTELVLDLYDCDPDTIRSVDRLTAYVSCAT